MPNAGRSESRVGTRRLAPLLLITVIGLEPRRVLTRAASPGRDCTHLPASTFPAAVVDRTERPEGGDGCAIDVDLFAEEDGASQIAGPPIRVRDGTPVAPVVTTLAPGSRASAQAAQDTQKIVGVTPAQVRWFTPPYYTDGRHRAQLFGDSGRDGAWVDRVEIPGDRRVLAHTHSHDELVTVIRGTWYVGAGARFDPAKLRAYPVGSFIVIPAGLPHFVATKKGPVIVQLNGTGKFATDYLEK